MSTTDHVILWAPVIGATMLLLAVAIEASSVVSAGVSGRLGRLSVSVILLMAATAALVISLDWWWGRG